MSEMQGKTIVHRQGARIIIFLLIISVLPACTSQPKIEAQNEQQKEMRLELVAQGLSSPLYVTAPPGDPRIFIVEQIGRIRIVKNGKLLPTPFLNLSDRLRAAGEQGLLSMAFHPNYKSNGYFYVNYTDKKGDTHVERYSVSKDPDVALHDGEKLILKVDQPFANHNGGHIQFGPDGMLYIAMGDGGSGGDPYGNGQNRSALLGKLLRIDIDHGDPYSIPKDNPFVNDSNYRGEIWAWGLRNPWRFAFDPPAKLLYIADVGQEHWEEVDVKPIDRGGLNYGWNTMEGNHCYARPSCRPILFATPALEYGHPEGCSITGGYVYRGKALPSLVGNYFYGDYCLGWIRSFKYENGHVTAPRQWKLGVESNIMSFGEDASHELYICYSDGKVYRFAPTAH
jgi:glucose/arabinose dehydrogenase